LCSKLATVLPITYTIVAGYWKTVNVSDILWIYLQAVSFETPMASGVQNCELPAAISHYMKTGVNGVDMNSLQILHLPSLFCWYLLPTRSKIFSESIPAIQLTAVNNFLKMLN
jgi:hypothetical protein